MVRAYSLGKEKEILDNQKQYEKAKLIMDSFEPNFQLLDLYPELILIKEKFEEIKNEATSITSNMIQINDHRINKDEWFVFSLLPEMEDRPKVPTEMWMNNQLQAPVTTGLVCQLENVHAFAFSRLKPGGHIRAHQHQNPYVTAIFCIEDGGESYIQVEDEKRFFKNSEFIIFDYTKKHEVKNLGSKDRIVLLILLDNKLSSPS